MELTKRYDILLNIRSKLIEIFEGDVIAATAYGSSVSDDFYDESDFDVLIFLRQPDFKKLEKVRRIKEFFKKERDVIVDFNVHSDFDLPKVRGKLFWHNNRGIFIQKEMTLYGITIIGENPFFGSLFSKEELRAECSKVINSLTYQARKLLINRELNSRERVNLMKWCIYSSIYALAFKGIMVRNKREALELFGTHFSIGINPVIFLNAKLKNDVSNEIIGKAYKFLSALDTIVFEKCKNGRI